MEIIADEELNDLLKEFYDLFVNQDFDPDCFFDSIYNFVKEHGGFDSYGTVSRSQGTTCARFGIRTGYYAAQNGLDVYMLHMGAPVEEVWFAALSSPQEFKDFVHGHLKDHRLRYLIKTGKVI